MTSYAAKLCLQIIRCTDDQSYPGWVECQFTDALGRRHTLADKVPIFSSEELDMHSAYPRPGVVRCEILDKWQDEAGREFVRVNTEAESAEGLTDFVVLATQIAKSTIGP